MYARLYMIEKDRDFLFKKKRKIGILYLKFINLTFNLGYLTILCRK